MKNSNIKNIKEAEDQYPTLSFTFLWIEQIGVMNYLFKLDIDSIHELSSRYTIVSKNDNNKFHDCPIYQIPKSDLEHLSIRDVPYGIYNRFIEKYSKDTVDLLITDDDIIKKNIKDIIDFTMNKIYGTDEMLIEFSSSMEVSSFKCIRGRTSSIPNLIYNVLQEYFTITTIYEFDYKNYIIIRKNN